MSMTAVAQQPQSEPHHYRRAMMLSDDRLTCTCLEREDDAAQPSQPYAAVCYHPRGKEEEEVNETIMIDRFE